MQTLALTEWSPEQREMGRRKITGGGEVLRAAGAEETVAVRPEVAAIGEEREGGRWVFGGEMGGQRTRGQSTAIREMQEQTDGC
jgi:hypothetical protein